MRVAIIGTRGIPNHYGGFEQCAQFLAVGLVQRGFEVIVYNSHNHPWQEKTYMGVQIQHCNDPEHKIGTAGQFIYDLNCIRDVRKKKCDVILQLGYTSSSVWGWLLPKKAIVTTNMDGLEWKRTKFSPKVRKFLLFAESLGVKYSNYLIADSIGIQDYLKEKYKSESVFIPYGANLFENPDPSELKNYDLTEYNYDMLIARLEPENSIEMILDGVVEAKLSRPFLVVGKHQTAFGEYLKNKYTEYKNIIFTGGIYDINRLDNLRYYSNLYFHGHTVGGTNPSLLEAMASNSLICANDNPFNRYVLEQDAIYFNTAEDITRQLQSVNARETAYQQMVVNNKQKIKETYSWENIIEQYANHLTEISTKSKSTYTKEDIFYQQQEALSPVQNGLGKSA